MLTINQVIAAMQYHIDEKSFVWPVELSTWIAALKHYKLNQEHYRTPEGPGHDMGQ